MTGLLYYTLSQGTTGTHHLLFMLEGMKWNDDGFFKKKAKK